MAEDTIFSKIIKKEIPAEIVYENEKVLAFKDIHPQAPVHILVIPKTQIVNLSYAKDEDSLILGELLLTCSKIAKSLGLLENGYRVVINNGEGVGQSVFHLHLHLLAGRNFAWPPG